MLKHAVLLPLLAVSAFLLLGCPQPSTVPGDDLGDDSAGQVEMHSELFVADPVDPAHFVLETNDTKYHGTSGFTLWTANIGNQATFIARTVSVMKASGVSGAGYGIVFCHGTDAASGSETMLVVMINNNREYIVGEVIGAEFTEILPWTETATLTGGYNQKNTIALSRDGEGLFTLSLNGTTAATFRDEETPFHTGGNDGYLAVISPGDDFPTESVHIEYWEE